jgi:hypothetical protein
MMEAAHTSETSVYYNETIRCNIPEGFNLQNVAKQRKRSRMKIDDVIHRGASC